MFSWCASVLTWVGIDSNPRLYSIVFNFRCDQLFNYAKYGDKLGLGVGVLQKVVSERSFALMIRDSRINHEHRTKGIREKRL